MDGLWGKTLLKWMIWGVPLFFRNIHMLKMCCFFNLNLPEMCWFCLKVSSKNLYWLGVNITSWHHCIYSNTQINGVYKFCLELNHLLVLKDPSFQRFLRNLSELKEIEETLKHLTDLVVFKLIQEIASPKQILHLGQMMWKFQQLQDDMLEVFRTKAPILRLYYDQKSPFTTEKLPKDNVRQEKAFTFGVQQLYLSALILVFTLKSPPS